MAVPEVLKKNVHIGFMGIKRYGMYLLQKFGPTSIWGSCPLLAKK
jgi:hypothetical protein